MSRSRLSYKALWYIARNDGEGQVPYGIIKSSLYTIMPNSMENWEHFRKDRNYGVVRSLLVVFTPNDISYKFIKERE